MNGTLMTLDQLVAEANAWLDCAKVAEDQARAAEISAGNILAEAKARVRAGEVGRISWVKWARENLKVSYRNANQCIALSRSLDPIAAFKKERAIRRQSKSQTRADRTAVPDKKAVSFGRVQQDVLLLSQEERAALTEWLTSTIDIQRDQYGNVLDPLAVRLKRVLIRLRKNRGSGNFGLRGVSDGFDDGLRELEEVVDELNDQSLPLGRSVPALNIEMFSGERLIRKPR